MAAQSTDEAERELEAFTDRLAEALDRDPVRALELFDTAPRDVASDPVVRLLGARALELTHGDAAAREPLEQLVREHPDFADARHALALVHEALGERDLMIEQFLQVRRLDSKEDRQARFDLPSESARIVEMARKVIEELPAEFRDRLDSVPVIVEARPSVELVRDGFDPRSVGLFEGSDHRDPVFDAPPMPPRIVLYAANLTAYLDPDDPLALETEVEITVLHEIGHYFGLEEDRLDELGLG